MAHNDLSYAFRQQCEAIATDQRYRLGRMAFDPLPAADLAAAHSVVLLSLDELTTESALLLALMEAKGWSAMLFGVAPPVVIYRTDYGPRRQEADLMHEIAHIVLKHPYGRYDAQTGTISKNTQHEREADYLGSCLQIPRRGMQWATQQKFTVQQTAEHFMTSLQMVEWRCRMTGARLVDA